MLSFRIRRIEIDFYFGFFAVIAFTFFVENSDSLNIMKVLSAALLHESGHLLAMFLFSQPPERICFYAGGIKIIPKRYLIDDRLSSTAVISAGCLVNLVTALAALHLGYTEFAMMNAALCIFNFLPFRYFDGGRLFELYFSERSRKYISISVLIVCIMLLIFCDNLSISVIIILFFVAVSELFLS